MALPSVAVPPIIENAKSEACKAPLPPFALNTASDMVTANVVLSAESVTPVIIGLRLSFNAIAPVVSEAAIDPPLPL